MSTAPELLTNDEVEARMYHGGIARATDMMNKAEAAGNAHQNPYAKGIYEDYVLPLAEMIRIEIGQDGRHAAANLLSALDIDAAAFLAVRTAVNALLGSGTVIHDRHLRPIAYKLGTVIHSELVLAQIEAVEPDLYHTLANDLGRRLSKDARHRMTIMKRAALKAGIEVIEWPIGARDQVGMYLMGLMELLGLIEISAVVKQGGMMKHKDAPREVFLAEAVMEGINESKAYTAISMPVFGPLVTPPRDWLTYDNGGFHTREMIRNARYLVHASGSARSRYRGHGMPIVLDAVNALQRTAWAVNGRVLDVVLRYAAEAKGTKEIVSLNSLPKPAAPSWLTKETDKATLTDKQKGEFTAWKHTMRDWYTERKLLGTRYGRFYSATRSAQMFRDYPAIWFVYFADSRGRLYPMTYGLNPQGSDIQKGLLHFSVGMPVDTPDAIRWFHVQGANKWGFDKATLSDRQAWVIERQEQIVAMADDPMNNDEWTKADSPLQFLAWAMEYRDWLRDTTGSFKSHLPISMDGSCNGLQNLSALLRDEVGGKATNLTANVEMEDIYRLVAEAATIRLSLIPADSGGLQIKWLAHGINRKVVKRSVMTTPYGVTRSAAEEYVISDYLAVEPNPFEKSEYRAAAKVLMAAVWPAIGDVVVKGREAMSWLRKSARAILKDRADFGQEPIIEWLTPSGFIATQSYFEQEVHRINSRLHGPIKLRVVSESEEADLYKHASGLAPNFVHSMDAAHLHRVTSTASRHGIDALAMIHDDYGTHAANAQRLYTIIREEFLAMYTERDPLAELKSRYPACPLLPAKGTLDLSEVLRSQYFFS